MVNRFFMIDLYFFRNNRDYVVNNLSKRGYKLDYDAFFRLDESIKIVKANIYLLNREHNYISFFFRKLGNNSFLFNFLKCKAKFLKQVIAKKTDMLKYLSDEFFDFLSLVPNLLHKSVQYGRDVSDNLELRTFINSKNSSDVFVFDLFKDFEVNKLFLDFDVSAKISGAGFVVLKGSLAELHRAIGNYMVDRHVLNAGYMEVYSPILVNDKSMYYSGHFPKFRDDQFSVSDSNLWLIPTAEVVLTNIVSNSILDFSKLPLKFVSKTLCFRKEKGNYGYLVKGMIRQHQFDKVELVHVVDDTTSYESLEELVFNAESVLQELDLSYRVLALCSSDIGFTAAKTYDIEVWMPKRKIYLEVSSCSNTETFQSIRMNCKIRINDKIKYPHILNGSGLAIGRILLAIIENYSDSFGNVYVPDVLLKYMNGKKIIKF